MGDLPLTDLVRELVRFLSRDRLGIDDVAERIGPVARDPGIPMPIELRPAVAGVRSARLARYPDSGLPYLLSLEPTPEARPTVAELQAVLGDYRRALTGRGVPPELIFSPPAEGPRWRVVVIVRLEPTAGGLETAPVTEIALRRDPWIQTAPDGRNLDGAIRS
jgi:hypothetical protein